MQIQISIWFHNGYHAVKSFSWFIDFLNNVKFFQALVGVGLKSNWNFLGGCTTGSVFWSTLVW